MRPTRRNSLIALLLLLTAQGAGPESASSDQAADKEAATRQQVEDSGHVRAVRIEAEREATEQAAQALAEEKRLTAARSEAFERLKQADAAVNDITRRSLELDQRRADAQARFDHQAAVVHRLIPIIVRLSAHPIESVLATGLPPEDAIVGIDILRFLARQAETDARASATERDALDAAGGKADATAPRLAAAEAARSYEADSLARQLAAIKEQRQGAEQDAADAARRAAAEAARAQTLRSMLQILETQRRLEEARAREDVLRAERDQQTPAIEAAHSRQAVVSRPTGAGTLAPHARPAGQLTPPVEGVLVRGWGDPQDGEPAAGQSYQTEAGARVVAPCGGTVAFAEPFRGYGLLVIIDCGGGYHTVLSGMDHIVVAPGASIQSGDPVGTMRAAPKTIEAASAAGNGATESGAGEAATDAGAVASAAEPPVLYLELRKGGRPINPAPWLKPRS